MTSVRNVVVVLLFVLPCVVAALFWAWGLFDGGKEFATHQLKSVWELTRVAAILVVGFFVLGCLMDAWKHLEAHPVVIIVNGQAP
jgi:fucose permease